MSGFPFISNSGLFVDWDLSSRSRSRSRSIAFKGLTVVFLGEVGGEEVASFPLWFCLHPGPVPFLLNHVRLATGLPWEQGA